MQAGPDLDAEGANGLTDAGRAPYRSGRSIEGGEGAVAGALDDSPTKTGDFVGSYRVVCVQEVTPPCITELCNPLGRRDDVGEQDRREHAVVFWRAARSCQEGLDLAERSVLVAGKEQAVGAWKLDVFRAAD